MNHEKHKAWVVTLQDGRRFPMGGEPCTQAEALDHAQGIWPGQKVSVEPATRSLSQSR